MIAYRMGKFIMLCRRRLGQTQEEFAGRFCAPLTLSRIENGHQSPGRELFEKITGRLEMACREALPEGCLNSEICDLKVRFEWNLLRKRYKAAEKALRLIECRDDVPESLIRYLELSRSVIDHRLGRRDHVTYLSALTEYFDDVTGRRIADHGEDFPDIKVLTNMVLSYPQLFLLVEYAGESVRAGIPDRALLLLDIVEEASSLDYIRGKRPQYIRNVARLLRARTLMGNRETKEAERICGELLESCGDHLFLVPEILLLKAKLLIGKRESSDAVGTLSERAYYLALDQWERESAEKLKSEFELLILKEVLT